MARPTNLLTDPPRLPLVAPSILAADFARMGDACRAVLDAGADLLHLDVMDGHFVPNLTMGPALCHSLRDAFPDTPFDVHLMVEDPSMFVESFADAGATHLTFHVEAVPEPAALARVVHDAGLTAGLALNPDTPVERVLPHVEAFDLILVMSVFPGYAGQAFIPGVLEKARRLRAVLRASQRLEVDGGVNATTAPDCRDAGCDTLVAATAVFKAPDPADAIATLRGA